MQPEIPAAHSPLLHALIYHSLVLPAIRSSFAQVRVHAEGLPSKSDDPLIIYLTHSSWWDAYMLFLMADRLLPSPRQSYVMMEAKQLRRYRFFRWCGAFSVERSNPRDILRSLTYISACLSAQPGRVLWIFPQGEIIHPDLRPISFYPGLTHIIRRLESVTLWPIALRYEFYNEQRAMALIRAGRPYRVSSASPPAELLSESSAQLTALASSLRDHAQQACLDDYQVLLQGRIGIDQWFDQLRERWLPHRQQQ